MTSLTSKETIEAKDAFEQFVADHDVKVKQYHADHECFANNEDKWLNIVVSMPIFKME